jgi:hypothetical protein
VQPTAARRSPAGNVQTARPDTSAGEIDEERVQDLIKRFKK